MDAFIADLWHGSGVPPLGERAAAPPVTQSQIAATIASQLGEDYLLYRREAARPLPIQAP